MAEFQQPLTPREHEVLELIVAGKPNKVIAHLLHITERTVENHRAAVRIKLGARNAADLVRISLNKPSEEI